MLRLFLLLVLFLTTHTAIAEAKKLEQDDSKATILAYHRIDEPQYPNSSLSFEDFKAHIKELQEGNYNVMQLDKLLNAIEHEKPLPPRSIAITFEGNHKSANDNAIPLLMEENLPFTLFIPSNSTKIMSHLDWKTLKKISKYSGADFGISPTDYKHISDLPKSDITRAINQSRIDFKKHMKREAQFFSYPFGEISNTLKTILNEQGFKAAFGAHSGIIYKNADRLALPRFTMTENYADIERFRMIANALPLPVSETVPENWKIEMPLSQIGFTLHEKLDGSKLSCSISNQSKPRIEIVGNRVEIIPREPITDERTRLNCIMPEHKGDQKQWRWSGMLFH